MSRANRKAARAALLRDMAALAALLEDAPGGVLPSETLLAAMATGSEGERRARLRRFVAEGWIDAEPDPALAETRAPGWLRGHGDYRLGAVRLWRLEHDDITASDEGGAE
jgi:hypothetical protein